jgi:hypothetical protein
MIYIVDIDGTICYTPIDENGKFQYSLSTPIYDRIKIINDLYDSGNEIQYWTARGSQSGTDHYELTLAQLQNWGAKFHKFNVGKPSYDIWIDDKAMSDKEFFDEKNICKRNL